MRRTLLALLLTVSSLAAGPTLEIRKGHAEPIIIVSDVGEIQTRSFVTDNITQPWNALKPTAEASAAEGEDLARTGSYVFSDKTELSLSVNARVEGSDVIVKG